MTPVPVTPSRHDLVRALEGARQETDSLFGLVCPGARYERPIPERHRILFYIGHVEAFDWNLLGRYALDVPSLHPSFDRLFAFGIDPPPGELPKDTPSDWPSFAEVGHYNHRVRNEIDTRLDAIPEQLLHVAIEHRLMHAETFAYILHQLPYEKKIAHPATPAPSPEPLQASMIEIPAGDAGLGLEPGQAFGWDNEFRRHVVHVPGFALSRYKVTNGEYLAFVQAGARPPFFWVERGGCWFYRGMFSETALALDHPVYVTLDEARAYSRWRGKSLPTEEQFQRALLFAGPGVNLDFERWDPVAVSVGQAPGTPSQLVGNGWEWTSTPFAPFAGFEPFPFYTNYSAPFFDGRHYVLKGASPRTAACFARHSFRNWFRPSYPYIYASFRLVDA